MTEYEKLYNEFLKSSKLNDELCQKDLATKSETELLDEYNKFIKDNNCKLYKPRRRAN